METSEETDADETNFLRCRNCGVYFDRNETVQEYYCSEVCAQQFGRCSTCGGFFDRADAEYEYFCSEECREAYYNPAVPVEHIHIHEHEEEEPLL
jgi:hypothetical protein